MGRAAVRQAITSYLQAAQITDLGAVFQHPAKFTPEGEFVAGNDPGNSSGAVIFVHLLRQGESRIALGGPTGGSKLRRYRVALICVFRSKKADTQQVGADNDVFLDSLVAAIEANRTAGAPGTVWQWGEGDEFGEADIDVQAEMPRPLRSQATQVFTVVEVTVIEWVNT